jgi:hypothetical protein
MELTLAVDGLFTYRDLEDGRRVVADTDQIRPAYTDAVQTHIRTLRAMSVRRRIVFGLTRTDEMFYHLFDLLNT